jgi:eukaryotic-like serine/threonine-protein kinase
MASPLLAGRYRLQEVLSTTSMAEVRLAFDEELGRRVVVKLLAPDADRTRFEREARAVAALAHPNIVQLFDFGDEERRYMVFEYLAGGSLEERLTHGVPLSDDEVARIAHDIASGLAHAHEHGVVHRDLKPGNILFDSEARSKIADFGIARVQGADTLTDAGTVLGTAAYISPEQVRGEPATPATDAYAFGVVVYRLLAGQLPFEAPTPAELARMHRDVEPPPLATVSGRNQPLAALAMSALVKEPSRRPPDGAALLAALDAPTLSDAATARIVPPSDSGNGKRRRVAVVAGFSGILLAACGAVAAILLTGRPASAPAVRVPSSPRPTTKTPSTAGVASQSSSVSSTASSASTATPPRTTSTQTQSTQVVTTVTSAPSAPPTDATTATLPPPEATTTTP